MATAKREADRLQKMADREATAAAKRESHLELEDRVSHYIADKELRMILAQNGMPIHQFDEALSRYTRFGDANEELHPLTAGTAELPPLTAGITEGDGTNS